jgi:hypothetical protein
VWDGLYRKTDGTKLSYRFDASLSISSSSPVLYPVAYPGSPAADTSRWNLADGPVQADRSGLIVIRDPFHGRRCVLDDRDVEHPRILGCVRGVVPTV